MQPPHLQQCPGFSDMSLLQQHNMFKQLQEIKKQQQQFPKFVDLRKQDSANQQSAIMKQATAGHFPPMINGTLINDSPHAIMNWMRHGASQSAQRVPNGLMHAQEQGQALYSLGLSSPCSDVSLYGTPVASGHLTQSSYFEGMPNDSTNLLSRASLNQEQRPLMLFSASSSSLQGGQYKISQEQVCIPNEAFSLNHKFQMRNTADQVSPRQGLYDGVVLPVNFGQGDTMQRNASVQEPEGLQRQDSLSRPFLEKTSKSDSSHGVSLDPLEQKILFGTDEDSWDESDIGSGGFKNTNGMYGALLQSAVAETSNNGHDLQEWSGLRFQTAKLSAENQPSIFSDSGKKTLPSTSFCSKPSPVLIDSNITSSFPGIKNAGSPFLLENRGVLPLDFSQETIQQPPKNDGNRFNPNQQQKSLVKENQEFELNVQLGNAWSGQIYQHTSSNEQQMSISMHKSICENGTLDTGVREKKIENFWTGDVCPRKTDGDCASGSLSSSIGGLEFRQSGTDNARINREGSLMNSFVDLPNLNIGKSINDNPEEILDRNRLDYREHVDIHAIHKENEIRGKDHYQRDDVPQSLSNPGRGMAEISENGENSYYEENSSSESHNSSSSQHKTAGHKVHSTDYQGSLRSSLGVAERGNDGSYISAFGDKLARFSADCLAAQTSQEGGTAPQVLSQVPKKQKPDTSLVQPCNQMNSSQQSGLRFAPRFQQLPHSNHFFASQNEISLTAGASSDPCLRNQLQRQISGGSVASLLLHSTQPSVSRLSSFNLALPHQFSQQFPILEAGRASKPSDMFQKSECSYRPPPDPFNHRLQTQSDQRGLSDQNLLKDAESVNSKEGFHDFTPETLNSIAQPGSTLETHPHQLNFKRVQHYSNQETLFSRRNFDSFGRPFNNLDLDASEKLTSRNDQQAALSKEEDSITMGVENPSDSKMDAEPSKSLSPSRDAKTGSFMAGFRAHQSIPASSGSILSRLPPPGRAKFGWNNSINQSSNSKMESNLMEDSQNDKNGQMLASLDMEQFAFARPAENSHLNSSAEQGAASISHDDDACSSKAAGFVGHENLQALSVSTSGVVGQTSSVLRPKKRKTATPVLLPWHKEVADGSQTLQNISMAKQDWAQATNCLVEKTEDVGSVAEVKFPLFRTKRRLTITTHLMQQLLRPAPPANLQADAVTENECALFYVAKLVLADACSMASCMGKDSDNTMLSEELRRMDNQNFSKALKGFKIRAKKLQNDLLRLDKMGSSILDMRLDCQELEKYSVMNRFVRFHGRSQSLQRYVTAIPGPGTLPDQTHCLSL